MRLDSNEIVKRETKQKPRVSPHICNNFANCMKYFCNLLVFPATLPIPSPVGRDQSVSVAVQVSLLQTGVAQCGPFAVC